MNDISLGDQAENSKRNYNRFILWSIVILLVFCLWLSLIGFPLKASFIVFVSGSIQFLLSCGFAFPNKRELELKKDENGIYSQSEDIVSIICDNIKRPPCDKQDVEKFIRNELAYKMLCFLIPNFVLSFISGFLIFAIIQN